MTRHMVLVHGAWQGSWAFDAWRPLLQQRGWVTHAVDLPGNQNGPDNNSPLQADLRGYTDHVCQLIRSLDEPVVLVGHSGGGITVSQVAEQMPDRVACLVYLAGMMLPSGFSFLDLQNACQQQHPSIRFEGISTYLTTSADGLWTEVRACGALALFLNDCEPRIARVAAAKLRRQAETGRAMTNTLTPQNFGRVPRIYVECTNDLSVLLPMQRMMQQLTPGAVCISLDCGHVPQLVQPQRLTACLSDALARLPGVVSPD